MKHVWLIGLLLVSATAAQDRSTAPAASEPRADRGVLAVLRRDGVIFPFASFRGTLWSAPWPGDLREVEIPINLQAVPERWWGGSEPGAWQAWLGDGASRPLQMVGPTQFRVHCAARLGIRTDYKAAEPVPLLPANPFPKDGLAATAGVKVEPIEIVPQSGEGWGALAVSLLKEFDSVEDVEVTAVQMRGGWKHPVPRAKRRGLPVRIESWYRINLDGGVTVSYIEGVRSYPARPEDDGCGLETLFSGWVHQRKDRSEPKVALSARITYCDRVNATYMLPLGRIRVDNRTYWVAQLSGHESEWYAVAELSRDRAKVVVEYFAGSRESCLPFRGRS